MKSWAFIKKPFRIALLLSPSLLLVAGCVHERVEYVTGLPPQQPAPVPQPAPQPLPAPAPAPGPILRGPGELDRMLAPIALYPDPLTAQILPAATVPDQVADASAYLRYGRDPGRIDYQPWDQSVKALTRYPDVLSMLAGNLPWTTDLGIAFENQPSEVFDSIQRLRAQARNVGNLRTTPEQVIIVENSIIQIVPANPRIIYVPVYQPEIVYVRPPPAPGRINVHFNQGRPIGPWLNHDVDWRDREVIVWKSDHARPQNWWYEAPSRHPRVGNNNVAVNNQTTINNNQTTINNNQTTINNNQTTINNNYTVWRPHGREAGSNNNSRATREPDNRPNQNQNPPVAAQPSPRPGSRNTRVTPLPGPEPVNTQNTVVSQPLPVNPPPTQALTNRVRPEPPRNIPATNTPPIVAHTNSNPVVRPGTLRPAPAAPAHTNRPVVEKPAKNSNANKQKAASRKEEELNSHENAKSAGTVTNSNPKLNNSNNQKKGKARPSGKASPKPNQDNPSTNSVPESIHPANSGSSTNVILNDRLSVPRLQP